MKPASSFRELDDGPRVTVWVEGEPIQLVEGANLAAALLGAGVTVLRTTPASGAPRAPYCMMGACFDCLVQIDGTTRQACMTTVTAEMRIARPPVPEAADAAK